MCIPQTLQLCQHMTLLQVLALKQAAQIVSHSHPQPPVLDDLLNAVAAANPFPAEVCSAAGHELEAADGKRFQQYVKHVDPDVVCHLGYVPIGRADQ